MKFRVWNEAKQRREDRQLAPEDRLNSHHTRRQVRSSMQLQRRREARLQSRQASHDLLYGLAKDLADLNARLDSRRTKHSIL
jgi:hypothetical protein